MDVPNLNTNDVARLQERYPPLFQRLPERLFAPLASPNRQRYWSLLCTLHNQRFGPDAPLPPSHGFPVPEITKAIAEEIRYQDWETEGDFNPATPLEIRANEAFNRLKDSGWLRVDRVGVRDMVTMPPTVTHFMSRLMDFARTGPLFVAGKIRSIEANLKLLLADDAGGDSLHEAAEQARNLLEHVRNTGTTVRDLMNEIGAAQDTKAFVRRFFDDFVERVFIGDYKELRTREPAREHWTAKARWMLERKQFLESTELPERQKDADDALETARNIFRNDVAVHINERLDFATTTSCATHTKTSSFSKGTTLTRKLATCSELIWSSFTQSSSTRKSSALAPPLQPARRLASR